MILNESIVEDAALEWFRLCPAFAKASASKQGYGGQVGKLCYAVGHGPHLAPGEPAAEWDYGDVAQSRVARTFTRPLPGQEGKHVALRRLNPPIPEEAREAALCKMLRAGTTSLTYAKRAVHRILRDGVPVESATRTTNPF